MARKGRRRTAGAGTRRARTRARDENVRASTPRNARTRRAARNRSANRAGSARLRERRVGVAKRERRADRASRGILGANRGASVVPAIVGAPGATPVLAMIAPTEIALMHMPEITRARRTRE